VLEGHRVRVLDNLSSGSLLNLCHIRGPVEIVIGDIRDAEQVQAVMDGMQGVFHEAALVSVPESIERPAENYAINVMGTLNVLEAARRAGVRRVVLASSAAVYGAQPTWPQRETMEAAPISPYAVAKLANEWMGRVHALLYGIEVVALRYFNVYGPRQNPSSMYSGVLSRFVDALRCGRPPVIFGDGLQTRDFVYVADVVAASQAAMRSERVGRGQVINVGTGRATSVQEALQRLQELSGVMMPPQYEPPRAGDVRHSVADISRAREWLGYEPRWSLEDGLRELWNRTNMESKR
jgi:UDP-glucose 4-epimerase